MNREQFNKIFDKAMEDTIVFSYDTDPETGKVYTSRFEVEPKLTIRDFSIDEYPDCDTDFDDREKAWEYFQSVDSYRLISVCGTIYADNYCRGDSQ